VNDEDVRWRKVAVLMVSLGQELAGELMRQFSDEDVGRITRAIADIKSVPADERDAILAEFEEELRSGRLPFLGGEQFARDMLVHALGQERAEEMWERLGAPRRPVFEALEEADPDQAAPHLRREHPQTIALILSQLSAPAAAGLLERLPADVQTDVAQRIATLDRVSPAILQAVEEGLAESLEPMLSGQQRVGGADVAAQLLSRVGSRLEKSLMARLEEQDPEVAESIRERLFTFDDIERLGPAEVRAMLAAVDGQVLRIALKAASKGARDAILTNVSERQRARLLEDVADLPQMRLSDVEAAQQSIVQLLRQLEGQGVVDLSRSDGAQDWV
jgi:flagellar motor switch protein FliG